MIAALVPWYAWILAFLVIVLALIVWLVRGVGRESHERPETGSVLQPWPTWTDQPVVTPPRVTDLRGRPVDDEPVKWLPPLSDWQPYAHRSEVTGQPTGMIELKRPPLEERADA